MIEFCKLEQVFMTIFIKPNLKTGGHDHTAPEVTVTPVEPLYVEMQPVL